jgi:hypothetical protein
MLDGLSNRLGLPDGTEIEQSIDGFIHLWRRLDCPDNEQIYWMVVYKTLEFARKETAVELEITEHTFRNRLCRMKKECNIKERSVRGG